MSYENRGWINKGGEGVNKSELSLDRIDHLLFVEHYVYSDSSSMSGNHYHNAYEIYYMLEGERY